MITKRMRGGYARVARAGTGPGGETGLGPRPLPAGAWLPSRWGSPMGSAPRAGCAGLVPRQPSRNVTWTMDRRRNSREYRGRAVRRRRALALGLALAVGVAVVVVVVRTRSSSTATGRTLDSARFADGS